MRASISRVKLFKACRRAYYLKYVEGLEPVEKAEALQTGSNYHELIEGLYHTGCLPPATLDWSKELAMATAYQKYIYPKFNVDAVEEWLEKPIGKHILVGRVDGIADDGCIVEHKTTSADISEGGEYEYNLLWDEQLLAYFYLTGTTKAYYTVIRKPTIRQKKDESDEEFFNRMVAWYDEDTDSKIRCFEVERTQEEVEQFAKNFEAVCDEMEHAENLYRNTCHCNAWGRRCEYSSVCLNYDPNVEYIEFTKGEK